MKWPAQSNLNTDKNKQIIESLKYVRNRQSITDRSISNTTDGIEYNQTSYGQLNQSINHQTDSS